MHSLHTFCALIQDGYMSYNQLDMAREHTYGLLSQIRYVVWCVVSTLQIKSLFYYMLLFKVGTTV